MLEFLLKTNHQLDPIKGVVIRHTAASAADVLSSPIKRLRATHAILVH